MALFNTQASRKRIRLIRLNGNGVNDIEAKLGHRPINKENFENTASLLISICTKYNRAVKDFFGPNAKKLSDVKGLAGTELEQALDYQRSLKANQSRSPTGKILSPSPNSKKTKRADMLTKLVTDWKSCPRPEELEELEAKVISRLDSSTNPIRLDTLKRSAALACNPIVSSDARRPGKGGKKGKGKRGKRDSTSSNSSSLLRPNAKTHEGVSAKISERLYTTRIQNMSTADIIKFVEVEKKAPVGKYTIIRSADTLEFFNYVKDLKNRLDNISPDNRQEFFHQEHNNVKESSNAYIRAIGENLLWDSGDQDQKICLGLMHRAYELLPEHATREEVDNVIYELSNNPDTGNDSEVEEDDREEEDEEEVADPVAPTNISKLLDETPAPKETLAEAGAPMKDDATQAEVSGSGEKGPRYSISNNASSSTAANDEESEEEEEDGGDGESEDGSYDEPGEDPLKLSKTNSMDVTINFLEHYMFVNGADGSVTLNLLVLKFYSQVNDGRCVKIVQFVSSWCSANDKPDITVAIDSLLEQLKDNIGKPICLMHFKNSLFSKYAEPSELAERFTACNTPCLMFESTHYAWMVVELIDYGLHNNKDEILRYHKMLTKLTVNEHERELSRALKQAIGQKILDIHENEVLKLSNYHIHSNQDLTEAWEELQKWLCLVPNSLKYSNQWKKILKERF